MIIKFVYIYIFKFILIYIILSIHYNNLCRENIQIILCIKHTNFIFFKIVIFINCFQV